MAELVPWDELEDCYVRLTLPLSGRQELDSASREVVVACPLEGIVSQPRGDLGKDYIEKLSGAQA